MLFEGGLGSFSGDLGVSVKCECMSLSYLPNKPREHLPFANLEPVVQSIVSLSIVSLTKYLRRQLVKYLPTTYTNTPLFYVGKMLSAA